MRSHLGRLLVVAAVLSGSPWAPAQYQQQQQQQQGGRGGVAPPVARPPVQVPANNQRPPQSVTPANQGTPQQTQADDRNAPPRRLVPVSRDPGIWDEKSWLCWWETNRDAVIGRMLRRQPAPAAPATPPEERARAAAALLKATQAARPELRAAAAVSLGQMREEPAVKPLAELALKDPDTRVRGYAWLALGLIGNADAIKAITAAKPKTEFDQLGVLAAVGMLNNPPEAAMQLARTVLTKPQSPEVARMAVWALRAQHRAADRDVIRGVLGTAPVPPTTPVHSEALLALGALADPRDIEYLANAASDGMIHEIPDTTVVEGGGITGNRNRTTYQMPLPAGQGPIQHPQGSVSRTQAIPNDPSRRLNVHRSTYTRVAASLALGMSPDTGKPPAAGSVLARNALIRNFAGFLDMGGPSYSGASIISFALATSDRDIYLVRNVMDMGTDPFIGLVNARSPMRGFAAVGLGLYMQNGGSSRIPSRLMENGVTIPGQTTTLPEYVDVSETLALRMANKNESSDFRAACALALGLSGDAGNLRRLHQASQSIGRGDELLLGYTTLALALLGDKSALNVAGPLLGAGPGGKIDVEAIATRGIPVLGVRGPVSLARNAPTTAPAWEPVQVPQDGPAAMSVLGRRAALLAVALLNDPRSQATLAAAWPRDRATVQDVARAIGWTRAYPLADPLTQLVEKDQKGAVEAAQSLGLIFDPDRPSRLSRLVIGNNYHQPQADYVEGAPSQVMLRDFPRLADLYLYSTNFGGNPATPAGRR